MAESATLNPTQLETAPSSRGFPSFLSQAALRRLANSNPNVRRLLTAAANDRNTKPRSTPPQQRAAAPGAATAQPNVEPSVQPAAFAQPTQPGASTEPAAPAPQANATPSAAAPSLEPPTGFHRLRADQARTDAAPPGPKPTGWDEELARRMAKFKELTPAEQQKARNNPLIMDEVNAGNLNGTQGLGADGGSDPTSAAPAATAISYAPSDRSPAPAAADRQYADRNSANGPTPSAARSDATKPAADATDAGGDKPAGTKAPGADKAGANGAPVAMAAPKMAPTLAPHPSV